MVATKPTNKMVIISADSSRKFISEFNSNKVSPAFIVSCKKAGKLFKKGK